MRYLQFNCYFWIVHLGNRVQFASEYNICYFEKGINHKIT